MHAAIVYSGFSNMEASGYSSAGMLDQPEDEFQGFTSDMLTILAKGATVDTLQSES